MKASSERGQDKDSDDGSCDSLKGEWSKFCAFLRGLKDSCCLFLSSLLKEPCKDTLTCKLWYL